ncbi:MAG: DNA phosphorothioation system sulfurtransferase DndC [Chitinophagaceae bacterium]|nr:DNA phosphorothioation system sulfurtransferase DndC [Chitinophagaceae bacterium]
MAYSRQELEKEILAQYQEDDGNIPWIIGFSGGKDSTMLLQLVWYALKEELQGLRQRPIYVVCNNTLVENPKIIQYTDRVLQLIEKAAMEQGMPIYVKKTTPRLEDTFWVNLLGKGYPAPNNTFRWCTERLKINPTSEFIKTTISEIGHAIILLGTRKDESTARAQSIEKNKSQVENSRLRKHPLPNAFVYAPITEVITEEVWQYLLQVPSPWGASNRNLVTIYNNATGGDCPLITDISTPSCGNSRFGCWVCTVVKKDKSMQALIDNGEEWMEPMVEFRDMLADNRNDHTWREPKRRNDQEGVGPYTHERRAFMLEKLLQAQKEIREQEPEMMLINYQELVAIQVTWHRDSNFKYSVANIYNKVYGTDLQEDDFALQKNIESEILNEVCDEKDYGLINELLELQKSKFILVNNYRMTDIETHLERFIKK